MNLHSIFFQLFVFQIQLLPNTKTINLRVGKWAKRSGVSLFPRPRPPPRPGYIIKLALMGKSVKRVLSMQMKEWALPHHMSGNTILSFWKMASCPCTRTISEPRQALKKKKKSSYIIAMICSSSCHVPDTTLRIRHTFSREILTTILWG